MPPRHPALRMEACREICAASACAGSLTPGPSHHSQGGCRESVSRAPTSPPSPPVQQFAIAGQTCAPAGGASLTLLARFICSPSCPAELTQSRDSNLERTSSFPLTARSTMPASNQAHAGLTCPRRRRPQHFAIDILRDTAISGSAVNVPLAKCNNTASPRQTEQAAGVLPTGTVQFRTSWPSLRPGAGPKVWGLVWDTRPVIWTRHVP
jgi:hypothetical protein